METNGESIYIQKLKQNQKAKHWLTAEVVLTVKNVPIVNTVSLVQIV